MVDALEEIHNEGFLHQDVKPENFRIQGNRVYLIDFGLSDNFFFDGTHKSRERIGFQGTPLFSSIKSLQGYSQSRRDDLESLGYSILYMMNPDYRQIPWAEIDLTDFPMMLKYKKEFLGIRGKNDD